MSAPCLHYGVESFEGLKAFRGADGKVRSKTRESLGSLDELIAKTCKYYHLYTGMLA